jgi:D-beta-D-heptose 7-phosphate kinase/D-beta-D-heptose 1-phosphate adenosyltransferase
MKTIVLVTGGFDPLHSGHIAYFKAAKELGDTLVVGVNSDAWLTRKKGAPFMPFQERLNIVKNIVGVDYVIEFNDDDGSAKLAIKLVKQTFPNDKIVFANGGDRTHLDIPEMEVQYDNLTFAFGVGGFNKANSPPLCKCGLSNRENSQVAVKSTGMRYGFSQLLIMGTVRTPSCAHPFSPPCPW